MEKLKPCPFCGGEAKIMKMGYPHWVYCLQCGAKVHGGTISEKDSIKAWNRRAERNEESFCTHCKTKDVEHCAACTLRGW